MPFDPPRVRALLDAVIGVGEGLDLQGVLDRIVSAACTLTGARYGALGMLDAEGRVAEFHSQGLADDERARLGPSPHGRGIPGLLLARDAAPVRLGDLAADPRFGGFPEGHPRMGAFLGVPVTVAGSPVGNLYVAHPVAAADGTGFGDDDEECLLALASAAGVAIGNARLYRAARRRQTWWEATSEAVSAVTGPTRLDGADGLAEVLRIAGRAAGADAAAVYLLRDGAAVLEVAWAARPDDGPVPPAVVALPGDELPGARPWPEAPAGAAQLLLPIGVGGPPLGALTLLWSAGPEPDDEDVLLMRTFAERVALALEASRAASDRAALALLQDRDRIARDLHDLVIQRLFAVGLSLQAAGNVARVPEVARRLARAVDDLDDTIKDVRRTIFQLHGTAVRSPLRDELEEIVATARADLGTPVRLVVEGPILGLPDEVAPDVVAVVREALSNVAKHAQASRVDVLLRIGRALELEISDDGVGLGGSTRRSGLANLEERAAAQGGTFRVDSSGRGTRLTWTVPRR